MAASFKTNLWHNIYIICLVSIIIIHFVVVTCLDLMKKTNKNSSETSASEYILMSALLILEWSLIIFQCKVLYKYIFLTDIKPIFCLYLSKILAFADIYLLLFKIDSGEFDYSKAELLGTENYRDLGFTFLNYSASIQTLTGISPLAPRRVSSELLSAIQVLLFGIGYSVFILSIAVLRFAQADFVSRSVHPFSPSPRGKQNNHENGLLSPPQSNNVSINNVSALPSSRDHELNRTQSLLRLINRPRQIFIENYLKYAKFFYSYMMLLLVCVQFPRLLVMYFVCDTQCKDSWILVVGLILDTILLLVGILSGIIRMRLIKTFGIRVNISIFGLIRSYMTVLVQFGLLYFDLWLWTKDGERSAFNVVVFDADTNSFWAMCCHFLYYSTATFTNVGSEASISTHEIIGQGLNSLQMVMAVIFHTVVFGVSLLDISSMRVADAEKFDEDIEKTNMLRETGLIQRQIRQMVKANAAKQANGYQHPAINTLSINE